MGIFTTDRYQLGVDIGSSGIKLCELEKKKDHSYLSTYGLASFANSVEEEMHARDIMTVASALKQVIDSANVHTSKAILSIPEKHVHLTVFDTPFGSDAEIDAQVREKVLTFLGAEVAKYALDYEIVAAFERESEKFVRVMLTAVDKNVLTFYVDIAAAAGLDVVAIETESMALARSLVGTDPTGILVLDIGSHVSTYVYVQNGFPRISRGIPFAGRDITSVLARSMCVDLNSAEQCKRDFGLGEEVPPRVSDALDAFMSSVSSVSRMRQFPDKIIMTGGSSRLGGLASIFEQSFESKVYVGNPWARIIVPEDMGASLKRISPDFSVAIGLAMHGE